MTLPRVVITAPGSGQGKTTVATGLMAALRISGLEVAGFKIGPDYIDPGYHALATGRPGRNLDPHLCHPDQLAPLLLHGAAVPEPAEVAIIEGVMGLFDGQIGGDGFASTAHVATLTRSPTVAVVDISHASRTVAAVVHGLHTFDPDIRLSGVILNKSGSDRHTNEVISALESTGLPVLGVLSRHAGITAPSRHLGLVPAAERDDARAGIDLLAEQIADCIDLHQVLAIAHSAPDLDVSAWDPADHVAPPFPEPVEGPIVAMAGGRAFTFRYAETAELLLAAGCRPVEFDPVHDHELPRDTAALYLGGGFPEVHAVDLSANESMRTAIRSAIAGGLPTVAECAGLLYLCLSVDGYEMVGALDATATMTKSLTLRYHQAIADQDHLLAERGLRVTGHEFHRTVVEPRSAEGSSGWLLSGDPEGFSLDPAGIGSPTVHASYLHTHWAGHPQLAQRFADAAHAYTARSATLPEPVEGSSGPVPTIPEPGPTIPQPVEVHPTAEPDLDWHGDRDIEDGLIDLAVNVRLATPPEWLATVINASTAELAHYPDPTEATQALAVFHGVPIDAILPTSGGAEAFTLIARGLEARHPLVVHPQFTEPEAALRTAGHRPERLILTEESGFRLNPSDVPAEADLVMIGNPTNPTGVLHRADDLRSLVRPGRVLVVDEAFMDAVPGETESLIGGDLSGILVLRSLTKTWGIAGLRAGFVAGDPEILNRLCRQQAPWSVSTPALAAMVACCTDRAREETARAAAVFDRHRTDLIERLASVGLQAVPNSATPFLLIDTSFLGPRTPGEVRTALRRRGFAVRRGETFPGLGPDWVRMAVRDPTTSQAVVAALSEVADELCRAGFSGSDELGR